MTQRALAGTLSNRVKEATSQVIAVGALSMGFQRMLGLLCSTYLPEGLHGCEGSAISVTSLGAFWSAVELAVWSKKLLVSSAPALISLLDGPAFAFAASVCILQTSEEGRIYRLLDYASTGSPGHEPITFKSPPLWKSFFLWTLSRKDGSALAFRLYASRLGLCNTIEVWFFQLGKTQLLLTSAISRRFSRRDR